ncbi:mannose-6-phosphate isomerase, class I [Proteiniclasticum sp. SCR006]|uniref:mannose-6-phosphate isomerase n=1 Tax=Proteiniclasticum aestuarii TaxID=2817862 RepID=A0A939H8Q6_9CLOT|nr:mannose-6-phosphate isomerase, class I [Proteiniclasticum aestuarii]MBO1265191.1 mannose-6-phosphate isomerase, class I [Proteiniclasticum aestuarii]
MQEILKLKPVFQERIWGGEKLRTYFDYDIPSDHTGECWAISAHRNGDCIIENGGLKGMHLSEVYENHRALFGKAASPVFPLLTKILDASDDLSVQVHPDDEYAMQNEDDLGKTECWYIIDCEEDAEMIYGHGAKTRKELEKMIDEGEWDALLQRVRIHPGDFFYVPSGTIHALCKGTLVLETQQSSDTTYRVYDYDRVDEKGEKRPLHMSDAKNVLTVPHKDATVKPVTVREGNLTITRYTSTRFFTVEKWTVNGKAEKKLDVFTLVSVLKGEGSVNGLHMKKGDHFILTSVCKEAHFTGDLEMIVSWIDPIPC